MIGGSYGGYMVLSTLAHYSDRMRAGIDIVGIANFITFLERTSPYRQDLRRAEYGDERDPQMRAVFERINPTAQAERDSLGPVDRARQERSAGAVFRSRADCPQGARRRAGRCGPCMPTTKGTDSRRKTTATTWPPCRRFFSRTESDRRREENRAVAKNLRRRRQTAGDPASLA